MVFFPNFVQAHLVKAMQVSGESAGFKSRLSLCVDFTILVQFLSAAHVGRGAHRESKRFLQVVPISVANVINPLNPFNLLERCPCHD